LEEMLYESGDDGNGENGGGCVSSLLEDIEEVDTSMDTVENFDVHPTLGST